LYCPVVLNNIFDDCRAEQSHPIRQPLGHTSAVQRKISNPGALQLSIVPRSNQRLTSQNQAIEVQRFMAYVNKHPDVLHHFLEADAEQFKDRISAEERERYKK